jgi:NAD(P)H-hydrate epimerase
LPLLPVRPFNAHKGTAGIVTVLAGSCSGELRMIGAPAFVAAAALRSGCGLVRILAPQPIIGEILSLTPSATAVALQVDEEGQILPSAAAETLDRALIPTSSLVIGPGMADDLPTQALALRAVQQTQVPVVVDAGAITGLSAVPQLSKDFRARAILTPHPGEFRRLALPLRITADPVNPSTRRQACEEMAQRLGCIVVLKGAGTVVSNGIETWVCTRGHPCLATAGTGDVLSGLLGGILAQHAPEPVNPLIEAAREKAGVAPPPGPTLFELVCICVEAHAAAGELWAQVNGASAGLMAMDLVSLLPRVLEGYRAKI